MSLGLIDKTRAYWRLFRPRRRLFRLSVLKLANRFVPNESQRLFGLTLIVGAVCGVAAVAFHLSITWAEELLMGAALASSHFVILGIFTALAGGLVCGALLQYVVPGARGSGIPQVKVAFAIKSGLMPLRDAVGKFFIGVLQIGSGGSLGREGPTVHICAGLASFLGQTFALSQKNLKRLLPVGVAAGIAAAFNAPIAAVTFTIEEVVGDLDQTVLSGVIVAAAIAAAIERSILGEHPVLTINHTYGLHYASSLLFYAILGIAGGGISLVFNESLLGIRGYFGRMRAVPAWAKPGVGAVITGILAVAAVYFLQTGGVNGGGYDTLSVALSGDLPLKTMAALCLMKIAATAFSYGSGGAGGIFAPALFIGGMLGGVVGLLDEAVLPHGEHEIGAFALVGMGAVFAGAVRAPITSVLIIFEMTGSYGLILPLMISNMTSYVIARHFRPTPIYEALLEQDGIHLPHHRGGLSRALDEMRVADAYQPNAIVLMCDLTVSEAYDLIRQSDFTTFPIVENNDVPLGVVTEMRLRRNIADGKGASPLTAIMDEAQVIMLDDSLSQAVIAMDRAGARQLSVVSADDERFLGVITMTDIVRAQAALMDGNISSEERSVLNRE